MEEQCQWEMNGHLREFLVYIKWISNCWVFTEQTTSRRNTKQWGNYNKKPAEWLSKRITGVSSKVLKNNGKKNGNLQVVCVRARVLLIFRNAVFLLWNMFSTLIMSVHIQYSGRTVGYNLTRPTDEHTWLALETFKKNNTIINITAL